MTELCRVERSTKDDWRVALHEAGHVIVGRVLGFEIGGATIVPSRRGSGMVWGPTYDLSELSEDYDVAPNLCSTIARLMPGAGESRAAVVDIIAHSHHRVIELMGGTAAETVLHRDDPPWEAVSDLRQARGYASLVCSPSAVEAFVAFALQEAIALVIEHRTLVVAVARALIDHGARTLNGAEIDSVIVHTIAVESPASERKRRVEWESVVASAADFDK
jgi:hypothetical protein